MPRINDYNCPHCDALHDGAQAPADGTLLPDNGDVTICFTCGEWGIFVLRKGTYSVRKATTDELDEINQQPECARLRRQWLRLKGLN